MCPAACIMVSQLDVSVGSYVSCQLSWLHFRIIRNKSLVRCSRKCFIRLRDSSGQQLIKYRLYSPVSVDQLYACICYATLGMLTLVMSLPVPSPFTNTELKCIKFVIYSGTAFQNSWFNLDRTHLNSHPDSKPWNGQLLFLILICFIFKCVRCALFLICGRDNSTVGWYSLIFLWISAALLFKYLKTHGTERERERETVA